jgi:hypothetical protein
MSDYFKAYRARLERNHNALVQLIKDVQKKDNSVEAYINRNDELINHVVFIKDESINSIGFHEVPYRWSGCGYKETHSSHWGGENSSMPFTADDVLSTFTPIKGSRLSQLESFKDKKHYLKWCSYLKKYEVTEEESPKENS